MSASPTPSQTLDRLQKAGAYGLTRQELGIINNTVLPTLILHRIVEWVPDSSPARYRISTAPNKRITIKESQ